MSRFFSPAVMETLVDGESAKVLQPREDVVSVLFCDVRGFSKKVEQAKRDLHAVLRQMSEALGVMTTNILRHEGVIADFQGDAALGFWGWPAQPPDGPLAACRAALAIAAQFLAAEKNPRILCTGLAWELELVMAGPLRDRLGRRSKLKSACSVRW